MKRVIYILLLLVVSASAYADCSTAISVPVGKECSYTKYTLGTAEGKLMTTDCGWTSRKYKEIWLKCVMPESGRLAIGTEGNYLDGYVSVYSGDCSNLQTVICSNNGRVPEVLEVTTVKPGETVYVRVAMIYDTKVGVCLYELEHLEKPECKGEEGIAANLCQDATLIKSPNGYCGNTSSSYSAEKPGNLSNVFCGSIENNSWLQFVASEETASLNVFTFNCKMGIGIQMRIYETSDCKMFTPTSNCWNPAIETNGVVTATGLTKGNRYYLMIDGYAGDVCDYTISAGEGVEVAEVIYEKSFCKGSVYKDEYFPEGLTAPGVYKKTITGEEGKETNVVLTLTEIEPVYTYLFGSIYSCERYQEYGFDVNTPGKHYQYLTSKAGCDSIVELELTVEPKKEYELFASICQGTTYSYNGFFVSKAGDYTRTVKSVQGCDSIVTLHLTVEAGLDLAVNGVKQICSGESTTLVASGGVMYIWKDANGNPISEGEEITLSPSKTTNYKLYSTTVDACPSTVTDCQGNSYPVVKIGTQCWMAENLKATRYDTESERPNAYIYGMPEYEDYGPCYFNPKNAKTSYSGNLTDAHRAKFGLLYTWAAAVALKDANAAKAQTTVFAGDRQGICPNGWHVPDSLEMKTLAEYVGGLDVAGQKLRTTTGWYKGSGYVAGTDNVGFSLLPAAFAVEAEPYYTGANGSIWSADPWTYTKGAEYYNKAVDMFAYFNTEKAQLTHNEKYYGRAVRCVKRLE